MKHIQTFESFINEAIDINYWAEYNTGSAPGMPRSYQNKSKDFNGTFDLALDEWMRDADEGGEISDKEIANVKKLAKEFYQKAGWISVSVIHAMITQI